MSQGLYTTENNMMDPQDYLTQSHQKADLEKWNQRLKWQNLAHQQLILIWMTSNQQQLNLNLQVQSSRHMMQNDQWRCEQFDEDTCLTLTAKKVVQKTEMPKSEKKNNHK